MTGIYDELVDFEKPLWLLQYYDFMAVFSTIVSLISVNIIVFGSGKMKGYKYYLLYIQLASWIMDIYLTTLMKFVPLFPVYAGYCMGILSTWFKISNVIQATMISFTVNHVASAVNGCFVRKHQMMADLNNRYKMSKFKFYALIFVLNIFPTFCSSLFYISLLDDEEQEKLIKKMYPSLTTKFHQLPNFIVFDSNTVAKMTFAVIFIGMFHSILLVAFTTWSMFRILRDNREKMSIVSYEKHRTTLKSLLAQFSTCSIVYLSALLFSFLIVVQYRHAQVACQWMLIMITSHSCANAITMILTYPPYRRFVLRFLKCETSRRNYVLPQMTRSEL